MKLFSKVWEFYKKHSTPITLSICALVFLSIIGIPTTNLHYMLFIVLLSLVKLIALYFAMKSEYKEITHIKNWEDKCQSFVSLQTS